MNEVQITINDKNFILEFGMKFFRLLGQRLGTVGLVSTQQAVLKVLQTFDGKNTDLRFEQLDMINAMVLSAVVMDETTGTVTEKELDDLFLKNTKSYLSIVTIIMQGFVASLPKSETPETAGKPKAPRAGKKN